MATKTDLQLAVEQLKAKYRPYTHLLRYYEGPQPLIYTTKKLEEIFTKIDARFSNNWVGVAVDATAERLELQHFEINKQPADRLNELWTALGMDADEEDIELDMLVCSEAFAIADMVEVDGVEEIACYRQDPRMCHVFYQPSNPKQKQFAVKWWQEHDGTWRLNLYYPDRTEYYGTERKADLSTGAQANAFKPLDPPEMPNALGIIPVIHFRYGNRQRGGVHDLVEPQDAFNKLLNDMMISSEFGAYKQRYIISQADVSNLRNAPNEIWQIPASDGMGQPTQVGQFESEDLGGYIQAMETQAQYIAIRSKAPKHYFFQTGGDPSGESLIASEAALNKHCKKIIGKYLTPSYQELGNLLLRLDGDTAANVTAVFAAPESVLPSTRAAIFETYRRGGAGTRGAAQVSGHTVEEVDKLAERERVLPSDQLEDTV